MGLDLYCGKDNVYSRPCSFFSQFRNKLAEASGLDDYCKWYESKLWIRGGEENNILFEAAKKQLKGHSLRPLLMHSDCDGYLSPKSCFKILCGLDGLSDKLESYYALELQYFAEALNAAVLLDKKLEFR